MERLLSRNRNIVVLHQSGQRCTNGSTIDRLYAVNRAYSGSANLMKASPALRPLLLAKTWTEFDLANFQRIALLLADHTDVLCEFINGVDLEDTMLPASVPQESSRTHVSKRKATAHPSPAAKKAARDEK